MYATVKVVYATRVVVSLWHIQARQKYMEDTTSHPLGMVVPPFGTTIPNGWDNDCLGSRTIPSVASAPRQVNASNSDKIGSIYPSAHWQGQSASGRDQSLPVRISKIRTYRVWASPDAATANSFLDECLIICQSIANLPFWYYKGAYHRNHAYVGL